MSGCVASQVRVEAKLDAECTKEFIRDHSHL